MSRINEKYEEWLQNCKDQVLLDELQKMNEETKEDAFYRDLEFGTGGLRGVLGVGTNRMNIYVVAKASRGLANYLKNHYDNPSIAISRDSRINSDLFAQIAAGVFAYNNIKVYIYKEIMPVPCLSYAVRQHHCSAGVMVTASHNPSKYNGYKVYGNDGCQIKTEVAEETLNEINKINEFSVKWVEFEEGINKGLINIISDEVYTGFVNEVKNQSQLEGEEINKNVSIVYTPLNGAGLKPVTRALSETGYTNITVVKEQEKPDGNFPTCPYPNPEIREAMSLGMKYAKEHQADLLLATDPDCDRVGVAVKDNDDYTILTGNEVGILLFDYICSRKIAHNKMPKSPVLVKTIVSTDLADVIAEHYGVKTVNVLTGFKYIGEQIAILEKENRINDYVFGFEESDGYLSGTYARDKDGVNAAFLVCEMFAYYKTRNISLLDKLNEIYNTFGRYLNNTQSYTFEGASGFAKMQSIMTELRANPITQIGSKKVIKCLDYSTGIDGLPKSDVLKYYLEDSCTVVIRPSGTEPKLKAYISTKGKDLKEAEIICNEMVDDLKKYFN